MEKMKMESANLTDKNIEKIAALFPNCITETADKNGKLKKAINFEMLRAMLSEDVAEGDEAYEFTWVGKKSAIAEANKPIRKTLRPCPEESVNWDTTENLYIEGDNLEVLKLLQESYLNKVKMIYIDPPYNTGNDFIYRDDFTIDSDEYAEESGQLDEDGNRLFKNTDSNGRFHSDWCSMMYSRLMLARNLLADDGVIFISIDDNEQDNLKKICDEVFGADNFIAVIVRNTNSSKNQSLFVSVSHEYCLVYAKDMETLKIKHAENKWGVPKNNVDEYIGKVKQLQKMGLSTGEITEELKSLTKYPRFIDFTNYWYFDERGLYSKGDLGGVPNGSKVPVFNPLTGKDDPIPPGGFRFNPEQMKKLAEEGRIHFHTDGSLPRMKRYLDENIAQRPKSIMSDDQRPDATLMQEFNTPFDNPKQLAFIKRIVGIMDKDSIVLDFFSGSATTAHAVMELNTEDDGQRKFIMVQIPEPCDKKSEAYKAGYSNICEIGKERIRCASKRLRDDLNAVSGSSIKFQKEHEEEEQGICTFHHYGHDLGFRVFKLDDTNMEDVYYTPAELKQEDLQLAISNIKEDRTDLDLLFGCLLEWGLPLSMPYHSEQIDGVTVHTYNDGDLIACFDKNIPESVVKTIAKRQPLRVVFRDDSFEDSPSKINVSEIFKMISTDTRIKVI
ncbi:MAG: site-specific DNA-methyltransferase [Oscillospiraceae bacterium]|nr:site-specific DNA-methyltransferase [Oscillospiraceae bacterium]